MPAGTQIPRWDRNGKQKARPVPAGKGRGGKYREFPHRRRPMSVILIGRKFRWVDIYALSRQGERTC